MARQTDSRPINEQAVRDLLDRYACPVPWHEVRTRFMGNIATPALSAAPLQTLKNLWGGEFPPVDSIDDLNALIDALINTFWNALTVHQKHSKPFRLLRMPSTQTLGDLGALALMRQQELEGFVEGLFNGEEQINLPERAHQAVDHLAKLRAMMAGIHQMVLREIKAESQTTLDTTFKHIRELTRIMEIEINEAILSCTRARRHLLDSQPVFDPTVH